MTANTRMTTNTRKIARMTTVAQVTKRKLLELTLSKHNLHALHVISQAIMLVIALIARGYISRPKSKPFSKNMTYH
jgi:hypothetical protein